MNNSNGDSNGACYDVVGDWIGEKYGKLEIVGEHLSISKKTFLLISYFLEN